ncbi:serine/threonine-protein kinase [Aequorivita marina]|uniref:serine/threonine-protein kinase n=1 Tax=Aequorivita marina TaxID=3073654 RepID=UPI002874A511|nr:serine/threonine-protein kinase [Aequorivita sp. S2608]MDS1297141.1 serine/threonine-protein kinase [Aequorivita sp. S2608]
MTNKIIGNYKVLKEIGAGGMSTVYLAENININTKVAIKMLHPHLVKEENIKKHILKEARTQAVLNHPNITKVIDFVNNDQGLFIILEYVEGETLSDYLFKTKGALSEKEANLYMTKILEAVGYAHNKGVVHRDLKAANIMISPNGEIKIMDFGIATLANDAMSITQTGSRMGSPLYMSPEQVTNGEVDLRSDIYSLGVVYHEMLTGEPIYDIETTTEFEIYNKIVKQPLPRLRDFKITNCNRAQDVIDTATAKLPVARYKSCLEFKNELCLNENIVQRAKPTIPSTKMEDSDTEVLEKPNKNKSSSSSLATWMLIILVGLLLAGGTYFFLNKDDIFNTNKETFNADDNEDVRVKVAEEAYNRGDYKKGFQLYQQIEPRTGDIDSKLREIQLKSDSFEKERIKTILQPHLTTSSFTNYTPGDEGKLEALLTKFPSIEMEFMILEGENALVGEGKFLPLEKATMNNLRTYYVAKKTFKNKNYKIADSLIKSSDYDSIAYITDLRTSIKNKIDSVNKEREVGVSVKKKENPIKITPIKKAELKNTKSLETEIVNTDLDEKELSEEEFVEPLLFGAWSVENENANYVFKSDRTGNYTNSRGKNKAFNWTIAGLFLNIKMVEGPVFVWQVRSHSNTRIVMDDMQNNIFDRVLKKN